MHGNCDEEIWPITTPCSNLSLTGHCYIFCSNTIIWKPPELWLPESFVIRYPKGYFIALQKSVFCEQHLSFCHGVSLDNPCLAICPKKCHCHLDTKGCMSRPCIPFVWDIQAQTQTSLRCHRSQLHSFCGLCRNVHMKKALAMCTEHAAFHLTNSSAFIIQLRNWKITVQWGAAMIRNCNARFP